MKIISFKCPRSLISGLDELVRKRVFISRSEAIRTAVRELLLKELSDMFIEEDNTTIVSAAELHTASSQLETTH